MFQFGQKCKDQITGFEGVAIGHVCYISGCNQVLLAPPINKDGNKRDAEWFDEQRLVQTSKKVIVLDNSRTPGFDKPAPKI